ncbi:MucR family transcriptional regulator [Methylobacterium sp. BTF04]|uniref:MucR family transcriptional regulator n=1 Tax=Methylobacterium sp. BTF04 TaxID=2708300 RepID=UPI0013D6C077|nr:MucR family transcriptional regulator [Methylobacterium sp. BTF04]NEU11964.1 MucR family transcriptional regulator [Methylobacterium sp. BTF04]
MDDILEVQPADFVALTGDVVSAYVSNNSIRPSDLADLIGAVHQALINLSQPVASAEEKQERATPAQIRKSITPDALVSFEDGKSYKTLRRHLTIRGLTPEAYRAKHGLPVDYPMTSASYSAQRSALAQSLGLGRHRQETKAERPVAAVPTKTAGRGRPRKTPAPIAAE